MAIGTLADFKLYEPQIRGAYVEQLTQSSRAFNEASRGAIAMTTESMAGRWLGDTAMNPTSRAFPA